MRLLITILISLTLLSSCNEGGFAVKPANVAIEEPEDTTLDIGDAFGGGIFAGEISGYHLITTPGNCNNSTTPTCNGTSDSMTMVFWDANTFCDDMVYGGKSDWYLPQQTEIDHLYTHQLAITGFNTDGFNGYWTYHQAYYSEWYVKFFNDGSYPQFYDYDSQLVRCVRQQPLI